MAIGVSISSSPSPASSRNPPTGRRYDSIILVAGTKRGGSGLHKLFPRVRCILRVWYIPVPGLVYMGKHAIREQPIHLLVAGPYLTRHIGLQYGDLDIPNGKMKFPSPPPRLNHSDCAIDQSPVTIGPLGVSRSSRVTVEPDTAG